MDPVDAAVTAWPGFDVVESSIPNENGQTRYRVQTRTTRPRTPIFNLYMLVSPTFNDVEVRALAEQELQRRFKQAHPDGCPGGH